MNSATAKHPIVVRLEAELLPALRKGQQVLATQVPSVRSSVFAHPVGSATSYQGYQVGISCLLSGVAESEPDEISLIVGVCHLDRQPRLSADVTWGNGRVEADLGRGASSSDHWPLATTERLNEICAELPRLISLLTESALRGHP